MIVGRRRGGMTVAQLHRYMVEEHGASVLRFIASHPDETPRRYIQNHVFDASFRPPGATPDPFCGARDFVTQVWFDSPEQAHAAVHSQLYLDHLQPDEDRFVDQTSVTKLGVVERPLFVAREAAHGIKLFVFHRRAPGLTAADVDAALHALWQPLLAEADTAGIGEVACNDVMGSPDGPPTVDRVDEVWLQDEAAARRLAGQWQALVEGPVLAPLLVPRSGFVLLARERVMFAGAKATS